MLEVYHNVAAMLGRKLTYACKLLCLELYTSRNTRSAVRTCIFPYFKLTLKQWAYCTSNMTACFYAQFSDVSAPHGPDWYIRRRIYSGRTFYTYPTAHFLGLLINVQPAFLFLRRAFSAAFGAENRDFVDMKLKSSFQLHNYFEFCSRRYQLELRISCGTALGRTLLSTL